MVDVEQVIYDYLNQSGTTLKTLIGNNLFVSRTEDFDGSTSKGLMFHVKGGGNHPNVSLHSPVVDFHCYGGTNTFESARAVYRALYDALHGITNQTGSNGSILFAEEITQGQNIVDPQAEMIEVWTSYQLTIRPNN